MTAPKPELKVGQVWERRRDGRLFRVAAWDNEYLDHVYRVSLKPILGPKTGGPLLYSTFIRTYDLIEDPS